MLLVLFVSINLTHTCISPENSKLVALILIRHSVTATRFWTMKIWEPQQPNKGQWWIFVQQTFGVWKHIMYVFVPIPTNQRDKDSTETEVFIANAEIDIQSIFAKHYFTDKKTSNQVKVCKLLNFIRNLLKYIGVCFICIAILQLCIWIHN